MPKQTSPRSDQLGKSNPDVKALPASPAAFLPPGEGTPASTASSPGADQEINLASESVAGEEDPGASLDMPASASSSSSSGGSLGSECGGSGQFGASACPRCNGSGKVAVRQGGA